MSDTNAYNDIAVTSEVATTPETPQAIEHGSLPAAPCNRDLLSPAARVSADSPTTFSDQNPLSGTQGDATSGASIGNEARGVNGTATHVMHKSMQTVQGSFRVYVTDTEAESVICHNGSVDGYVSELNPDSIDVDLAIETRVTTSLQGQTEPLLHQICVRYLSMLHLRHWPASCPSPKISAILVSSSIANNASAAFSKESQAVFPQQEANKRDSVRALAGEKGVGR